MLLNRTWPDLLRLNWCHKVLVFSYLELSFEKIHISAFSFVWLHSCETFKYWKGNRAWLPGRIVQYLGKTTRQVNINSVFLSRSFPVLILCTSPPPLVCHLSSVPTGIYEVDSRDVGGVFVTGTYTAYLKRLWEHKMQASNQMSQLPPYNTTVKHNSYQRHHYSHIFTLVIIRRYIYI